MKASGNTSVSGPHVNNPLEVNAILNITITHIRGKSLTNASVSQHFIKQMLILINLILIYNLKGPGCDAR